MSYFIEINVPGNSPRRVPLQGNSGTIGSAKSCQIPIEHHEVSAQALLIDVRGGDFWVQNLNPYSIYVGLDEVTPNAWSPWTNGETIQLTQSVSLTMINEQLNASGSKSDSGGVSSESKGMDVGKLFQVLLIGVCFVGAGFILFAPKKDVAGVIDKEFEFNEVVEKLELKSINVEYETVRRYLQQAFMADRRWSESRPETVMKFYELLVNHRLVRENPNDDATLDEVASYAKRRLSTLRFDE